MCIYVFEIPDFDCLVEGMRFDAVFHQHIHYFSLDTLSNLIISCGGEIISHEYNFQGSCGGALFISFKKASCKQQDIVINVDKKHTHILKNIKSFEQVMNEVANQLDTLPRPVYGYGAGLMLATYAYHLRTDLSFLETLLDDDHKKDNTGYKNLPIKISHPSNLNIPTDCSFMITSLENIRPIYNRIQNFWVSTGDLGFVDQEKLVNIVGRIKDVIIRGGENIYPAEIEAVLSNCPGVEEASVYGVQDEAWGEIVGATVFGINLNEEAIRNYVASQLAAFKVPKYIFISDTPLERNAAGKLLAKKIKEKSLYVVMEAVQPLLLILQ